MPTSVDAHLNEYTVRSYRRAQAEPDGTESESARLRHPSAPGPAETPAPGTGSSAPSHYRGPPPLLPPRLPPRLHPRTAAAPRRPPQPPPPPPPPPRRAVMSQRRYCDIMARASSWLDRAPR